MRILGLDLGSKTMGIAISDETLFIATGLETFRYKPHNFEACYRRIDELIAKYNVDEIVFGMPYYPSGDISPTGRMVSKFIEILKTRINLPIYTINESHTSFEAESYMIESYVKRKKRKEVIDKMAAVVILQSYLDNRGGRK